MIKNMGWILMFGAWVASLGATAYAQVPAATPAISGGGKGFESFKRNVFPILQAKCAACHSDTDGNTPRHTIPDDPALTYSLIKHYVTNFGDLKNSKLVTEGLRADMAGGSLSPDVFVGALQKWWDEGENTAFFEAKKILPPQRIPVLPKYGEFVTLKWDLGDVDSRFKWVRFEIEIQKMNGAYQLRRPRIVTVDHVIEVRGIHLLMNGTWDAAANAYARVGTVVPEDGLLSHAYQIVLGSKGEGNDEISFAFDKLEQSIQSRAAANLEERVAYVERKTFPLEMKPTPQALVSAAEAFDEKNVGKAAKFVAITAPVDFEMGKPKSIQGYLTEPLHRVRLTRSFEMQVTPVTQLQWYLVMRYTPISTPSSIREERKCDLGSFPAPLEQLPKMCKHHPVENVSWDQMQEFIVRLNTFQSTYTYRLPTEAEWEYIARAGLPPEYAFGWGNDPDDRYMWRGTNSNRGTHAVATRLPTASPQSEQDQFYDMYGNVKVWLQDIYSDYPEYGALVIDPQGAPSGGSHIIVGISAFDDPAYIRRNALPGGGFYDTIGLRLVRTPR